MSGKRVVSVAVRLTEEEAERLIDSRRGSISRSAFIRWRLLADSRAHTLPTVPLPAMVDSPGA